MKAELAFKTTEKQIRGGRKLLGFSVRARRKHSNKATEVKVNAAHRTTEEVKSAACLVGSKKARMHTSNSLFFRRTKRVISARAEAHAETVARVCARLRFEWRKT